jgi:hypothetical protein
MDANGVTGAGQLIELSAVLFGYVSRRTITHGDLRVYAQRPAKMGRFTGRILKPATKGGRQFQHVLEPGPGRGLTGRKYVGVRLDVDAQDQRDHGNCYHAGAIWANGGCAYSPLLWTVVRGPRPVARKKYYPAIRLTNASGVKFYWAQMPARVFRSLHGETVAGSRQSSGGVKTSVDMVDDHMVDKEPVKWAKSS